MKKPPALKQQTRGQRVIAFIERYCKTPEGEHVGKLMVLDAFLLFGGADSGNN